MKTLNDDWHKYRNTVYPGTSLQAVQLLECHKAFMAGALCFCQAMDEIAAMPEKESKAAMLKIQNEVWEINAHRAHTLKARN